MGLFPYQSSIVTHIGATATEKASVALGLVWPQIGLFPYESSIATHIGATSVEPHKETHREAAT